MAYTFKKLTNDQICQLKAQAGDEAAMLIDKLMDEGATTEAAVEALEAIAGVDVPTEAGTYYLTVTVVDDEEPVFAWAALPAGE